MIKNQAEARRNNGYISMPYVVYHFFMLTFSLIGVSTTIMMVAEALFISLGYSIGKGICYAIVLVPVVLFTIGCILSKDQDLQLNLAKWFSLGFRECLLSRNYWIEWDWQVAFRNSNENVHSNPQLTFFYIPIHTAHGRFICTLNKRTFSSPALTSKQVN